MDETGGERRRLDVSSTAVAMRPRFVLEVIGWVLLGLVALVVIDRSRHVLGLVVVAIVLAVLLHAPITALDRLVPRWAAITIVVLVSIASVVGLLALGTVQLHQEVEAVGGAVTERIESVDPESMFGQFLVDGRVAERVTDRLDDLPSQLLLGSPDPAEGARLGLEALLVIVLTIYALVNGPRLRRALSGGDHPRRWVQSVGDGVESGASQVRRLVAVAVVSGCVGFATASAFGLQGATVLAIWVGLWAVVPIFGPIVGYAPMIVVASLDGWPRALAVVVLATVIAVASSYLDHHMYASDKSTARRIGPFGLAVALVVGLRFGWLTGPVVAIFVMAAAVSSLAAFGARPRTTALAGPAAPSIDNVVPPGGGHSSPGSVWGRLDLRSGTLVTSMVVGVVVAIALVIDLAPVPVWILIGIVLSIALDPLVEWLAHHTPLGRGASVGVIVTGLLAVVAAALVFAVPSIAQSIRDLDDQLPRLGADLERLPLIGDELAERGVAERLQTTLEKAPGELAADPTPLEGALRSIGDGLIATFWILLITVTALIDGRRVRTGLRNLTAPHRRPRFDRVDEIVGHVIARYAVGSVAIAAIAGTAVFTIAVIGGVPLAPLLGLAAALTNFIPQVGSYLGGAPLVVLALTTGTSKGLIILATYLVYMQIENRIIQPVIVGKAVDISPFVAMVAVLVGGAAAGVVGAVLVTPMIGVAKALHRERRNALSTR